LESGGVQNSGDPNTIINEYIGSVTTTMVVRDLRGNIKRRGSGEVRIIEAAVKDKNGSPCSIFNYGDDICFEYILKPIKDSPKLVTVVWIKTVTGINVLHLANHDDTNSKAFKVDSNVKVSCTLRNCSLIPGNYIVSLWIAPDHYQDTDFVSDALQFRIEQGKKLKRDFEMSWRHGIYHTASSWEITPVEEKDNGS
jgi:hypothetical protein